MENVQATIRNLGLNEQQQVELQAAVLQYLHMMEQQAPQQPVAEPDQPAPAAVDRPHRRPKLPSPPAWDGKGDVEVNFILPMKRFLKWYKLEDDMDGVEYILAYLPTNLQMRYMEHCKALEDNNEDTPTTPQEVFELLVSWCTRFDRIRVAREKLERLKHYPGKIAEYNNRFSELSLILGDRVSLFDLNWRYIHGLQPEVLKDIEGHFSIHDSTTSSIMTLASLAEARIRDVENTTRFYHRYYDSKPRRDADAHPVPQPAATADHHEAVPMELGAMRFTGTCYKCHKRGHKAANCPCKSNADNKKKFHKP